MAFVASPKSTKEELYAAIKRERKYQLEKYPPDNEYRRTLYGHLAIAEEELDEAFLAFCKHIGTEEARKELLQVVASCVAWHDYNGGDWDKDGLETNYKEPELPGNFHPDMFPDVFPVIRYLQTMRGKFEEMRATMLSEPRNFVALQIGIDKVAAMGMRCLMVHGVVEREEFNRFEPVTDEQADAFVRALQAKTERDQQPKTISVKANERGFLSGDFEDLNGILCSIQRSSLATDNAIWLGVHPTPSEHEKRGYGPTRMHLNRQHVAALLPLLQHFVETGELPQAERGNNE